MAGLYGINNMQFTFGEFTTGTYNLDTSKSSNQATLTFESPWQTTKIKMTKIQVSLSKKRSRN